MSYHSRRVAALIAGAAVSSACLAQVGPDVIVGDLPNTSFYTTTGAINGMHAYAVGTTSCNLGDQPLEWIASTNRHPVISQNMYRLANGRFEQIGQAFLKHGFTALQGSICSTCTPYPNGSYLGAGCSDPYSSSLNGGQTGLGPKYEVNAATGAFPYPFTNVPFSGTLGRRLQASQADLSVPGALYFVGSMYIAPDDIEAGNGNNNQSYRRVTINSNYALTLEDTTQRTKPAIQAWRDHGLGANTPDPSVTIVNVDVPGDGRFILAYKVSDNGNGTYHYEYAIQNFRSDRAGQAFTIPAASGTNISNVGFHDVDYHSGEPYALSDWTPAVSAAGVSWATQTFAQNPNANALRWDTIYNFRFDADSAPASGAVTLDLFKPGTPTSISIPALVPGGGPPPPPVPPANDDCGAALAVAAGTTPYSSNLATTDGPAEPTCFSGDTQAAGDVWFTYAPPCDGDLTISTCGAAFDTRLAVYTACPASGGASVACNDDAASCGTGSSVTFAATGGTTYRIRVGGASGVTGAGTLTITPPTCTPTGPANDACAAAITLADGATVNGTLVSATNDGTASCGSSAASADVWYAYTPATSAAVTFSTCGTASFDTVLSVFSACGGTQVGCLDDTTGCAGYTTRLVVNLTAGNRYLVRVAGYNGATGTFSLNVTGGGGGATPPATDNCENRAGVGLGSTAFTTVNATTDGPAHASCLSSNQTLITNDIWFNHPATVTGTLVVSLCGASYDTFLAVYNGYGCADFEARLMACNDDFACGSGTNQSQVSIPVVAGTSYTIRIGGYNSATGSGNLALSMQQAPAAVVYAMGFEAATSVPGVGTVQNEDLVTYNTATGQWAMLFDGSDVGLGAIAIDAFAVTPAGDFLLSFTGAASIPGLTGGPSGTTVDDSDIVRFVPSSTGSTTAGSFVFHFDGSDVGLTTDNEDVDAITLASDGRLVISTLGAFTATGASGNGEDLIIFNAATLGAATSGAFAMHFDGSDVALTTTNENVDAACIEAGGALLLSTSGSFTVAGLSGNDEDVAAFTPTSLGAATAGSFAARLDLSALAIATGADVTAFERMPTPPGSEKPAGAEDGQCRADFNADTVVDSRDFADFLSEFLAGNKAADFDDNTAVDSRDLFAFLSRFMEGCF